MKNWFLLLILVAAAGWAFQGHAANCRDSFLTVNLTSPVRHFTLDTDDYEIRNYGRDHLAWAIKIVRLVLDEEGCAPNAVNFGQGSFGRSKSRCSLVSAPKEESLVCYVESNLGYFMVIPSYDSSVSVIYHQWD